MFSLLKRYDIITALVFTLLVFGACTEDPEPGDTGYSGPEMQRGDEGRSNPATFTNVRPGELEALLENRDVIIIDVRTPQEWENGTVDGALRINLQDPGFTNRIAELDTSADYLIYCNSGNRSRVASRYMLQEGFRNVYNYDGMHFDIRHEHEMLMAEGN